MKDQSGVPGRTRRLHDRAFKDELVGLLRSNGTLMHNKFLVLTRNDKPVAVLFGSTNLTLNGLFGHANAPQHSTAHAAPWGSGSMNATPTHTCSEVRKYSNFSDRRRPLEWGRTIKGWMVPATAASPCQVEMPSKIDPRNALLRRPCKMAVSVLPSHLA